MTQEKLDLEFTCELCGEKCDELTNTVDGDACNDCLNDYTKCYDCGEYEKEMSYIDDTESVVCETCSQNYHWCDQCDTLNGSSNPVIDYCGRPKKHICDYCVENSDYGKCENCGEIHENDEIYTAPNGDIYCEDCFNDRYFYCEGCDDYRDLDDYGSDGYCTDCSCGEYVESYGYKPHLIFKGDNKEQPYLGYELEVEVNSNNVTSDLIDCHLGHDLYFLTSDSSLDKGFEITSMPMTLDYHKEINEDVKSGLEYLSNIGCERHDTRTCGLHVHIDRRNMTANHRVKFEAFINRNFRAIQVFARRKENTYCKFVPKSKLKKALNNVKEDKNARRNAVNWENKNTVEIRIFKGTLNNDTLIATLEFCNAVYNFTKSVNCKTSGKNRFQGLKWSDFIDYVENNNCPKLIEYLQKRNLTRC